MKTLTPEIPKLPQQSESEQFINQLGTASTLTLGNMGCVKELPGPRPRVPTDIIKRP